MQTDFPSWKQKIDPAFDKLIKFYIQFLDQTGLPANSGWIVLEPDVLKIWKERDMPGWIKRHIGVISYEELGSNIEAILK